MSILDCRNCQKQLPALNSAHYPSTYRIQFDLVFVARVVGLRLFDRGPKINMHRGRKKVLRHVNRTRRCLSIPWAGRVFKLHNTWVSVCLIPTMAETLLQLVDLIQTNEGRLTAAYNDAGFPVPSLGESTQCWQPPQEDITQLNSLVLCVH